jgi:ectoine hydroxylase-related dioxygenase (phytanoyl-CoA dioxygenase family)
MLSPSDIESHVTRIGRDGYTIVENAVELAFVEALRADLERIEREEKVVPASNIFEGLNTVRIYNL